MSRYGRSERDRDDPNVQWMGAGESYRPGGGSSAPPYRAPDRERPQADTWSAARRDERRDDRREDVDSYVPPTSQRASRPRSRSPGFRRRSRSPAERGRDDTYTPRARTPPRRFSPRRDERPRSPPRRRSPSPRSSRPRSPFDSKRPRDYAPGSRRSSPPAKRERPSSPIRDRYDSARSPRRNYSPPRDAGGRGGYRPRSRTPPRRDDRPTFQNNTWKRSPSPRVSGPGSNNTSRRSSPPVHPDRASLAGSLGPRSPAYAPARNQYDSRPTRSPSRTEASPAPRGLTDRSREPTPSRPSYGRNGDTQNTSQPPAGPGGYRAGNGTHNRPPPSGPSGPRGSSGYSSSPPSGPSSSISMSAHNRPSAPGMLVAPTRPRGAPPGRFDAPTGPGRDFPVPSAPRARGGMPYRGSPARSASWTNPDAPPIGPRGRGDYNSSYEPRGGGYGRGAPISSPTEGPFPFRQHNNSSSTTYPRTQRFNVLTPMNHLTTTEKLVPGGKLQPTGLPAEQERKMKMLEAEAERIRAEITEKQKLKRESEREWEVRERESEREALKSELAEASLNKLSEGEGAGAAF